MQKTLLPTIGLALLASPLAAQATTTIHPVAAATAGNTNNNIPMSWYATRYQQIQDYDSFEGGKIPWTWTGMNFRMNSSFANGNYGGFTRPTAMWLSLTPSGISAANASRTFANNIDTATLKQVIAKKTISMPKLANTNFDFKLKFDTSATFLYTGLISKRNLCLEIRTYGSGINTYPLDAYRSSATTGATAQNGSYNGCMPAGVTQLPTHTGTASTLTVGNASNMFQATGYTSGNPPAIFVLGTQALNITLPGGCNLMNDPLLVFAAPTTGSNAQVTIPFPIPDDSALNGVDFYTQVFWYKLGITPIDLYSSVGRKHTIGPKSTTGATRVYAYSSSSPVDPDNVATATGSTTGYGLVTQYQR